MAWTSPMTAVDTEVFTAGQFNTHIRDNLNATGPRKVFGEAGYFATLSTNEIEDRGISQTLIGGEFSNDTDVYQDVKDQFGGTAFIATYTGHKALVMWTSDLRNEGVRNAAVLSCRVSGPTTISASNDWGMVIDGHDQSNAKDRLSCFHWFENLTPGRNFFTLQLRSGSNGNTAVCGNIEMLVLPY